MWSDRRQLWCVFGSDLEEARAEISLKLSRYASRQQPEDIPVAVISEGRFRQVIIAARQQSAPMVLLRLSESAAAVWYVCKRFSVETAVEPRWEVKSVPRIFFQTRQKYKNS